ncbi:DUF4192 domain-containing protein [Corynebacterium pygosceleis]|uniref:DUF4192 domain-containing protein n=1 Tax=Corynebacterium pygosceleis TaxID=2800406 RepID=A0A9Q4C6V7_9CORY|nr:DUF4192 domain-containing protein [Corynebacterium pygosceleis]MCK7636882.1 DUF4192 domain-containing protein [Corynebacterium pygosceleis]MCK7674356.1 DUF4192 domain-containing protein [Corynebacterium pygosceleis]MCL0120346.1 DUF4192 domain-containing protein [Corynebacterium pygosceleis]MCX7467635.1 DUF4192 domain-containing protein [Corynebacterium pygosceleis]
MTETLSVPGDLIASIPVFLGFYPGESLVMVALDPGEPGNTRSRIGPVTRADVSDMEAVSATLGALGDIGVTVAFGFLIGEDADCGMTGIATMLCAEAEKWNILVPAVWWVPHIMSGIPYRMLTVNPRSRDAVGHRRTGVVPDVATGAAMRALVSAEGVLPELNRRESLEYFARRPGRLPDTTIARIVVDAESWAAGVLGEGPTGEDAAGRRTVEHRTVALLDGIRCSGGTGGELPESERMLAVAAKITVRAQVRDVVLGHVLSPDVARPLAGLMLAAARTFSGEIRCNALCVHAVTSIVCGRTTRIWPALRSSHDEDPGHRLTGLLLSAYRRGRFDLILESCR